jgi:hypothetical protein
MNWMSRYDIASIVNFVLRNNYQVEILEFLYTNDTALLVISNSRGTSAIIGNKISTLNP